MNSCFTLTEAEYAQATLQMSLRRLWVLGLMMVGVSLYLVLTDSPHKLVYLLAFGAYAIIAIWWIIRRSKAVFRDQPSLGQTKMVRLFEDRFEITGTLSQTKFPWSEFYMWRESGQTMLLFINRAMSIPIPKRAMTAEIIDYMKQHLSASGLAPGKARTRK